MSPDGLAFNLQHKFESITCCNCQCLFAVPAGVRKKWVESGANFYCPNGHVQHYTESDTQRLRKQIERLEREKSWAANNAKAEREARERTERRLISQKGAATKLRNRIANGVCPCCTRSFANLGKHMKHQHPDWQSVPTGDEP